jgi:hypothetical protein
MKGWMWLALIIGGWYIWKQMSNASLVRDPLTGTGPSRVMEGVNATRDSQGRLLLNSGIKL